MAVLLYAQHVLGMGHLFRSLAIAEALAPEAVHLVTGGAEAPAALPPNVHHLPLPPLMMDADFSQLHLGDGTIEDPARRDELVSARFVERTTLLRRAFAAHAPDLLLVELYPFGRKRFSQELLPLLSDAKGAGVPVVCSLRDILVEKKDPAAYEARVVKTLNQWFNGLLVHSDPDLFPLEATFTREADITVPLAYTGYVAPTPAPSGSGQALRDELSIGPGETVLTASIGGGAVGLELLQATIEASALLQPAKPHRLLAFAGPFMEELDWRKVQQRCQGRAWITLERFSPRFQSVLAATDLSISLAGYNTVMGLLVQRTRGLVLPFDQNREQRLRAEVLASRGLLHLLNPLDLQPEALASRLEQTLQTPLPPAVKDIQLDGAAQSASILDAWRRQWPSSK